MNALPYQSQRLSIDHDSAIGHARRVMVELAEDAQVAQDVTDRAALVLNELAMNVVRHTRGGDLFVQVVREGVEIVACDNGPGIGNVGEAMRDGHSTAGTAGNGLGAVRRTASSFELHSLVGVGTIAAARIYGNAPVGAPRLGALCVA
ncbi:MAG: ATP-binding protein, partial [Myxococcota bacterium]